MKARAGAMTLDELLNKAAARFGPRILKVDKKSGKRAYIEI